MDIGPLEYVVIGVNDQEFTHALASELNAIHETGQVRVVDLLFVTKAADGSAVMQEVTELTDEESAFYDGISDDLIGLLTSQDIEQLMGQIPPDTSAVVIVFEHSWVIGLTETLRKGEGMVFTGGMVTSEALAQVNAELAVTKGNQDA